MFSLNNIRIKPKLISLFLIVGLLPMILIAWFALNKAEKALENTSFNQLSAVRDIKKTQIADYFNSIENNIDTLDLTVKNIKQEALNKLESISTIKKSQLETYFKFREKDVTILSKNDLVIEAIEKFETAFMATNKSINGTEWQVVDEEYGNWLTEFNKEYGYYDLFLIAEDGDVVYSVAKESDLGENLLNGQLKDSGLGKLFRKALKGYAIVDFEPYAPSNGDQAAFIGAPIKRYGKTIGVVALQLPVDIINQIVQKRDGMTPSGENFLVGKSDDGKTYLRSDRVVKKGKIGNPRSGRLIKKAISGEQGFAIEVGSTGVIELFAYFPVEIPGLHWALMATASLEEVLAGQLDENNKGFFDNYMKING